METREVRISLEAFIKRHWRLLALVATLVVAASVLLFLTAISGKIRRTQLDVQVPVVVAPPEIPNLVQRKLDGILVAPEESSLQAFSVIVENAPDARPLMGPAKASVVVEAPVEGGFTRFLLVFDATSTVAEIGPVRSVRPYFVDWADGLKAVFAHVGGSPEGMARIQQIGSLRNINEFFTSKYFWRSTKRSMPHNVYTSMKLLREAAEAKAWDVGTFQPWQFATSSERGDVRDVAVPYTGSFRASWKYDPETNMYRRYQGATPQSDADGTPVQASNVIILSTESAVLDEIGRLRIRTIGSGKATIYRNGQKFDAVWRRSAGEWLRFETVEGKDVELEPGQTWISVLP